MLEREVYALLRGTSDAAIAVAPDGRIRSCNIAAELLFGLPADEINSKYCVDLLCGEGAQGQQICSHDCAARTRAMSGHPTDAFDCSIHTSSGRHWVNVSTITLPVHEGGVLIIHLLRDVDSKKKLESLTRQFLNQISGLSGEKVEALLGAPAPHVDLSAREQTVLRLLAQGRSTRDIAAELNISVTTVRNHVNHILQRLSAHSRTEAVLRAVRERLI
jgi:PAS domain S-box-containing protein